MAVNGRFPVKKVFVKDQEGTGGMLSIWCHFIERVEMNKIYQITNMRIEKYPKEKPHMISTTSASKILDISDKYQKEFQNVLLIDGSVCGTVGGFFDIFKYQCCPSCNCKVDDTMVNCATCKLKLNERASSFKYELILNMDNGEMLFITGWFPSIADIINLPTPFPTNEAIEECLNNAFDQKQVVVEFKIRNKDKKNMEKLVHKITLKN